MRQNLYLDVDVIVALESAARAVRRGNPKANKSRIASDLLREGLARQGTKQIDVVVKPALERLATEVSTLSRNGSIHFEAMMLLVEHMLIVMPPARDQDAASQAIGKERFRRFIDQLGRRLADGGTSVTDELDEEETA